MNGMNNFFGRRARKWSFVKNSSNTWLEIPTLNFPALMNQAQMFAKNNQNDCQSNSANPSCFYASGLNVRLLMRERFQGFGKTMQPHYLLICVEWELKKSISSGLALAVWRGGEWATAWAPQHHALHNKISALCSLAICVACIVRGVAGKAGSAHPSPGARLKWEHLPEHSFQRIYI